jgi:hypothetical protein
MFFPRCCQPQQHLGGLDLRPVFAGGAELMRPNRGFDPSVQLR